MRPLFSIVIANYNYGRFLDEAIQSVLAQSCRDFELIIVDGGSTDESVEIIKKHSDKIAWWCSEKDGGQSAAFNKGFSHAKGRFLTWLNADDIFLPGALKAVEREIARHPKGRWFVGGSVWGDAELKLQRCFRAHRFSRLRANTGSLMVGGPSSFFEKSLLEEVGGVDESLHFVMDIDLWYRFYRQANQIYYRTRNYVWAFRIHEQSKMSGPTVDPNSEASKRKRARLAEEGVLMRERYGFGCGGCRQKFGALLSMSLVDRLFSSFDEWRFQGQPVKIAGENEEKERL